MSMGEEARTLQTMREELEYEYEVGCIRRGEWKQRDGTIIDIMDMTERHIRNCIRMLKNSEFDIAALWIERFEKELRFRQYIRDIMDGRLDA